MPGCNLFVQSKISLIFFFFFYIARIGMRHKYLSHRHSRKLWASSVLQSFLWAWLALVLRAHCSSACLCPLLSACSRSPCALMLFLGVTMKHLTIKSVSPCVGLNFFDKPPKIFTQLFLTAAKLQLWSGNGNNFFYGWCYHNSRNVTKGSQH